MAYAGFFDDIEKLRDAFIAKHAALPTELRVPKGWKLGFTFCSGLAAARTMTVETFDDVAEYKGMKVIKADVAVPEVR
jgi:hypothetical protein